MKIMQPVQNLLYQQYQRPTGPIGRIIGAKMVRQHEPEVQWTIALLDLKATEQVLEIGCGAGRALELAVPFVMEGHVSGVDYSATMVEMSRRRNAQAIAAGRLEIVRADLTSLPFTPSQFDTIWSIHTLYFWSDRAQAFAEITRVLKPGGLLVLTFSPGKVGESKTNSILTMIEEDILPLMRKMGFTVSLKQGPNSRQFQTIAIMGRKEDEGVQALELT